MIDFSKQQLYSNSLSLSYLNFCTSPLSPGKLKIFMFSAFSPIQQKQQNLSIKDQIKDIITTDDSILHPKDPITLLTEMLEEDADGVYPVHEQNFQHQGSDQQKYYQEDHSYNFPILSQVGSQIYSSQEDAIQLEEKMMREQQTSNKCLKEQNRIQYETQNTNATRNTILYQENSLSQQWLENLQSKSEKKIEKVLKQKQKLSLKYVAFKTIEYIKSKNRPFKQNIMVDKVRKQIISEFDQKLERNPKFYGKIKEYIKIFKRVLIGCQILKKDHKTKCLRYQKNQMIIQNNNSEKESLKHQLLAQLCQQQQRLIQKRQTKEKWEQVRNIILLKIEQNNLEKA